MVIPQFVIKAGEHFRPRGCGAVSAWMTSAGVRDPWMHPGGGTGIQVQATVWVPTVLHTHFRGLHGSWMHGGGSWMHGGGSWMHGWWSSRVLVTGGGLPSFLPFYRHFCHFTAILPSFLPFYRYFTVILPSFLPFYRHFTVILPSFLPFYRQNPVKTPIKMTLFGPENPIF